MSQNLGSRRPAFRPDPIDIAALVATLAVSATVLTLAILSPLKDDIAWLLYVARKWLGGQRLYEDLVEVNPPLVIWLYALPAWVGETLGIPPKLAADPFFASILLGCTWWAARLCRGLAPVFAHPARVFAAAAILLMVLPGVEFGQREHLLAACLLPYLARFVRDLGDETAERRRWGGWAVGVVVALGCALKPNYLLIPAAIEAFVLLRTRWRVRAEAVAIGLTVGLYGLAVLAFCPAFLTKAVPLAMAIYGATDTPLSQLVWDSRNLLIGVAVAALLLVADGLRDRRGFSRRLFATLVIVSVLSTALYLTVGKNWFYHRLPALVALILAMLLWLAERLPGLWRERRALWRHPVRLAGPVALVGALGLLVAADVDRLEPWVQMAVESDHSTAVRLEVLLRKQKAKTYIAFSEWIALGFPVVNDTGVSWASRFDSMWALRGEIWRIRQDGVAPRDFPIRQMIVSDFVSGCPDVAVVDGRQGFNYIGVLASYDAGYARAWSHYHQIARFDGLRVFQRDNTDCRRDYGPGRKVADASVR